MLQGTNYTRSTWYDRIVYTPRLKIWLSQYPYFSPFITTYNIYNPRWSLHVEAHTFQPG